MLVTMNIGNSYELHISQILRECNLPEDCISIKKQTPHFGIYWELDVSFATYEVAFTQLSRFAIMVFQRLAIAPRLRCFIGKSFSITPFYVKLISAREFGNDDKFWKVNQGWFLQKSQIEGIAALSPFPSVAVVNSTVLKPCSYTTYDGSNLTLLYDLRQLVPEGSRDMIRDYMRDSTELETLNSIKFVNPDCRVLYELESGVIPINDKNRLGYRVALFPFPDSSGALVANTQNYLPIQLYIA